MKPNQKSESESVLYTWRKRILNFFLTVVAIAAGLMTIASILDAIKRPGQWALVILYSVLELILAGLAQRIEGGWQSTRGQAIHLRMSPCWR